MTDYTTAIATELMLATQRILISFSAVAEV